MDFVLPPDGKCSMAGGYIVSVSTLLSFAAQGSPCGDFAVQAWTRLLPPKNAEALKAVRKRTESHLSAVGCVSPLSVLVSFDVWLNLFAWQKHSVSSYEKRAAIFVPRLGETQQKQSSWPDRDNLRLRYLSPEHTWILRHVHQVTLRRHCAA